MKKLLLTFLMLIPTQVFSAEPDKNLHNKCIYPTVAIFNMKTGGSGSGVVLRSEPIGKELYLNVVLTCAHIFHQVDKISELKYVIVLPKYKDWSTLESVTIHNSVVYEMNQSYDMAIVLFLTDRPLPVATISFDKKIYIGTEALRIGYGLGAEVRVDFGRITALNSRISSEYHPSIRTSIYTVPGDSGGPVFVEYEIVGIMQFLRSTDDHRKEYNEMSHFIPIEYLKKWDELINKEISFVYDHKKPVPVLTSELLKVGHWRTFFKLIPETRWTQ